MTSPTRVMNVLKSKPVGKDEWVSHMQGAAVSTRKFIIPSAQLE